MDQAILNDAITTPDGSLRNVTRIEIEILDAHTLRWTIWNNEVRLCSLTGRPADIRPMLRSSEAILRTMTGLPPEERSREPGVGSQ